METHTHMSKLVYSDKEQTVGANFVAWATSFFSSDNTLSFVVAANSSNSALAADLNALQTQNTVYRISNLQANPMPLECFPSIYEFKDEIRGTTLYVVANYLLVFKLRPALFSSAKGVGVIGLMPELSSDFMPLLNELADDYLSIPSYLVVDSNYLLFENPKEDKDHYVMLNESQSEELFRSESVVTGRLTKNQCKVLHHTHPALTSYREYIEKHGVSVTNKQKQYTAYGLSDKPLIFYSNVIPKSLLLGFTKVKAFTEMINYAKSIGVYDPMEMAEIVPNNTFSTYKISNYDDSFQKNIRTVESLITEMSNVTTAFDVEGFRERKSLVEIEDGYKPMCDMKFKRSYETGMTRKDVSHFVRNESSMMMDYSSPITKKDGAPNAVLTLVQVQKRDTKALEPYNKKYYVAEATYVDRQLEIYPLMFSYFPVRLGRAFDLSCYGRDVDCYMNMSKIVTTPTAWPIYQDQIGSWSNNYIVATTGATVQTNIKSSDSPSSRMEAKMKKNPIKKGVSNSGGGGKGSPLDNKKGESHDDAEPINKIAPSSEKSAKPTAVDMSSSSPSSLEGSDKAVEGSSDNADKADEGES